MDGEQESDKRRRLAVEMAPLRTPRRAVREELPIANEPSSGCPGRVLVPLGKRMKHLPPSELIKFARRRPSVERRGEDLPFDP